MAFNYKVERLPLEEIRPDKNNVRKEFANLDILAHSFESTPGRPGEPITPIIVVRDGDVFRIVDGERRYRAMMLAMESKDDFPCYTAQCDCLVFDDPSDAASLVAMMATNMKEPLNDMELSMGIQQMMCLGVPDEQVENLGRIEHGHASRIRRVMRDKPLQMSLDTMFSIADIDDQDIRYELVDLAESNSSDFKKRLELERKRQVVSREVAEFGAAFAGQDIVELVERKDIDDDAMTFFKRAYDPSDIAGIIESVKDRSGIVAYLVMPDLDVYSYCHVNAVFMKPDEGANDEYERARMERQARIEQLRADRDFMRLHRLDFWSDVFGIKDGACKLNDKGFEQLSDYAWEKISTRLELPSYEDGNGFDFDREFPKFAISLVTRSEPYIGDSLLDFDGEGPRDVWEVANAQKVLDLYTVIIDAGFEPAPIEQDLVSSIRRKLEACDVAEDESEDEGDDWDE